MIAMINRALRSRHRDDRGLGLPELLVTMALMSIVSVVVVTLFVSVTRAFNRDTTATDNTNSASIGMNELTRVLRAGTEIRRSANPVNLPVFITATHSSVEMHAFLDTNSASPRPVKIAFTLNAAGELVETRYAAIASSDPYWTFSGAAQSTRVIARNVSPSVPTPTGTAMPLFTYVDVNGDPMTPATGSFSESERAAIAAVAVSIEVQSSATGTAKPVRLENTVGIPNLSFSRLGL